MELVPQAEWRSLSPQEKITRLLGKSLDRIDELLDMPPAELSAGLLNAQMQAIRVVVLVSAKLGIEERRSEDWRAYVEQAGREAQALERGPEKARSAKPVSSHARKRQKPPGV
jgi:hypothetical protein